MKKKNIVTAACIILSFAFLTGCTAQEQNKHTESGKAFSSESKEENQKNNADESEPSELTHLRAKIKENNAAVGVAYIDFLPHAEINANHHAGDFSTSCIFDIYPFLSEYPISVNVGLEMFAVVPASTQAYIKVYKVDFDDDGELFADRDTVLYEDKTGKPFVLLCNDHESYSNVLITIQDSDETVEFSPRISVENGNDLVLSEGCYDFTVNTVETYE